MNRPAAFKFLHFTLFAAGLAGCSSVQVMDMEKVQRDFSQAVQMADGAEQRSRTDFVEKKKLNDSLKKANSPGYRSIAAKSSELLATMSSSLQTVSDRRKAMMKANAQLTPLAYSAKKIHSGEPNYALAEAATKDFEAATGDVNRALAEYAAASNSLAELVAEKKLFFNFDVADFYVRLQRQLEDSQNTLAVMQDGLDHIEAGTKEQGVLQTELEQLATSYAAKAQNFAKLNRKMEAVALGAGKISSLEARWPAVQAIVAEFDGLNRELSLISEKFNRSLQDFRAKPVN